MSNSSIPGFRTPPAVMCLTVLAALAAVFSGCRVPLHDAPLYRAVGSAEAIGQGLYAVGVAQGGTIVFPGVAGGSGGVQWAVKTRSVSVKGMPFVVTPAKEGSFSSIAWTRPAGAPAADLAFSVKIDGAAGARRILASNRGASEIAISPSGEDAQGFDVFPHDRGLYIAWCAGAGQERAVRFANLDSNAVPRNHRIPFDADRPYLTSPSVSPIGVPGESAVVLAYAAAPSSSGQSEVRVARISPRDDGLIAVGAPKPVASHFVWSRAPRVRASARAGLVVFEGLEFEGAEPAVYAARLNASGDPIGAPQWLLALRSVSLTRTHATPLYAGNEWFLAYEETVDGEDVSTLLLQRLTTE